MLLNYLKITFAVLKRHPFFTFVSLFGICFTMTVLIVVTAFVDDLASSGYPQPERDRNLYVNRVKLSSDQSQMMSNASLYLIRHYLDQLKTPDKIGFSGLMNTADTYLDDRKVRLYYKYSDANFWDVTRFKVLEGRLYTNEDLRRNEKVIVITNSARDELFGKNQSAVGKTIDLLNNTFRVIGVIQECSIVHFLLYGEVYIPYTFAHINPTDQNLMGPFTVILRAPSAEKVPAMHRELQDMVGRMPVPKDMKTLTIRADGYFETITRIQNSGNESTLQTFYLILATVALSFMLLPAVNLVNLNISRMMERASEIGIRKAFGASSGTLVWQFVTENVILTILGGILAILVSSGILALINGQGWIPGSDLAVNWRIVLYAFGLILFFGLLSGVYPAWRMSRLQIASALKGGE